jgi:hypothetical protein
MFNPFNSSDPGRAARLEWQEELEEFETRWFGFLAKLEARMEDLCSAALPELKFLGRDPDDASKQVYHKVLSGVQGQLENIRTKAYDTHDEKAIDVWYRFKADFKMTDPLFDTGYAFRQRCDERYEAFVEYAEKFAAGQGGNVADDVEF